MKKLCLLSLFTTFYMQLILAQETIPLYDGAVPNSKPYHTKEVWEPQDNGDTIISYISKPTLSIFLPSKKIGNGAAVIICPGGGYSISSFIKEGCAVAKIFNEWGIAAFVVKYRIPNDSSMIDKSTGPLQDAQRAIQVVRMRAKEWNIDTNKVGVMGFSAGGHLAASAATHFGTNYIQSANSVNLRPDFAILIYPVISFQDSIAHTGSRDQLIGKHPSKKMLDAFSNELQVTANTPPSFLVHATDDDVVPVMNSVVFYEQLVKYKRPAEMHLYKSGGHGFGMHNPTTKEEWMEGCKAWMKTAGYIGE